MLLFLISLVFAQPLHKFVLNTDQKLRIVFGFQSEVVNQFNVLSRTNKLQAK